MDCFFLVSTPSFVHDKENHEKIEIREGHSRYTSSLQWLKSLILSAVHFLLQSLFLPSLLQSPFLHFHGLALPSPWKCLSRTSFWMVLGGPMEIDVCGINRLILHHSWGNCGKGKGIAPSKSIFLSCHIKGKNIIKPPFYSTITELPYCSIKPFGYISKLLHFISFSVFTPF